MSPRYREPVISEELAFALIRQYLQHLSGYNETLETKFVEAVLVTAVNVDHARTVLSAFEEGERCPSIRQVKDSMLNAESRFKAPENLPKKWLAEGSSYDPNWSRDLIRKSMDPFRSEVDAMHLEAIRDMLHYTEGAGRQELDGIVGKDERRNEKAYWSQARAYDLRNHAELVEWVRQGEQGPMPAIRKAGQESRRAKAMGVVVPSPPPITIEDVEREKVRWEEEKAKAREAANSATKREEELRAARGENWDVEEFDDGYREPEGED